MSLGTAGLVSAISGGIGRAIFGHLAQKGVKIFSTTRRTLDSFWDKNIPWPSNAIHAVADLTREKDVIALFNSIADQRTPLDIVVNCVGGSLHSSPISDFPDDKFDEVIAVNFKSAFLMTKHAFRYMKEHNGDSGGNIIHIVSSSAKNISHNKAPYGAAKAGLAHFIHYAASEGAPDNILVNGISPTYVFTKRHEQEIQAKMHATSSSRESVEATITKHQLIKKPLLASDLLPVVDLLGTTRVITGQIYNVTMGEVLSY